MASQAIGIWLADRGWVRFDAALVLAALVVVLVCLRPRCGGARALLACALAALAGAGSLARQRDAGARWTPAGPRVVTLEATLARVERAPAHWWLDLRDSVAVGTGALPVPPRVRLAGASTPAAFAALEDAVPGDRVRVRVRLRQPGGLRNPGRGDSGERLLRAGIGAEGRLAHPSLHARVPEREGWRPLAPLWRLRARIARVLVGQGAGGALLAALALGDRGGLPGDARDAFAALGIAHLLAVSGLHLALAAALAYALLGRLLAGSARLAARWDTRSLALALAVLAASLYALLSGGAVPVRRAWVLLLAMALPVLRGRPARRLPALALAAAGILALEPEALFAPGAQLSFAATAALLLGARGARSGPAGVVRASATAVAVTAPLAAWRLGSSAPLALAVNLVAVPWTGLVLLPAALGAAAAIALVGPGPGAGPLAPMAAAAVGLAGKLAGVSLASAQALAAVLPGTSARAAPATAWLVVAAALGACAPAARSTRVRVGLATAVGAVLWWAPVAAVAPAPPRAVFLDVGQGDATLVQGRRAALLVDAGSAVPGGPDLGRVAVVPALRALGVARLDLVVASHGDLDHVGGLRAVVEALPVGALWLPRGARRDGAYDGLRAAARRRAVPVFERGQGDAPLLVGDLRVTPLWPPADAGGSRNDRSLVLRVECGARALLLPGDLGAGAEAALVAGGADLHADVLKLSHHGSRSSSGAAWLAAVGARVAIASAPCEGRFGMPHAAVRARARAAGLALWWTGRDGAVRVGLGEALHVVGTGSPRRCGIPWRP